eukprot:TRINITY_DN2955_c0_g1_i4.p2 TRINITY_DN2955_c0_g1~~TRINITY_DN2955_c0_g1_i4.p2  ORF type:complete len:235 (+),score=56.83 TRINITY_DN2955_c0_g1_i4:121-825(+)
MPERKMGMAMGQDCELLAEVCDWINSAANVPVIAKMTPNITDISIPAQTAYSHGCEGVSAINTIQSVMGINLQSLRPEPCVEGYTTPGGYSSKAVKPIALARVMAIATMLQEKFPDQPQLGLSGIGGVETGRDAAEFILLGAHTVQVCTGVMVHGYGMIKQLCGGLQQFMSEHDFNSVEEFRGYSLQYFTTHSDLVARQKTAIEQRRSAASQVANDADWSGDEFVRDADSLVAN